MSTALAVQDTKTLRDLLNSPGMIESMRQVLPKHLTPDRLVKMALVAASKQPKLLQCTGVSICKAVMTASELGLDCSGTLGSGYLVPYKTECQFIPGYRGLIDLARRSGQISRIESHIVYKQDEFTVEFGLDQKLIHRPYFGADRQEGRDNVVCVYGIAELRDNTKQLEVMTVSQIEAIRRRSPAGNSGPWCEHWEEMARKTVVRRLCKYLPMSAELERALTIENELEPIDTEILPPKTTSAVERLTSKLGVLPPPDEQADAGVDEQPTMSETGGSPHDDVIEMLSKKCECSNQEALAVLNKKSKPLGAMDFLSLPVEKLASIRSMIQTGNIKVEPEPATA